MTRGQALAKVASYVAGMVQAGDLEEATGLTVTQQEEISADDLDRLEWAAAEVVRRLHKMGTSQS